VLKQSEVVPRKASKLQSYETVPQTDTGGLTGLLTNLDTDTDHLDQPQDAALIRLQGEDPPYV